MKTSLIELWGHTKGRRMKSIQIELPDKLGEAVDMLIQQGWFHSEEEVLRFALLEFLRRQRLELHERFQRDDIAWALRQRDIVE
jgi:Arc/MetJ-type ribon-helix-helix transcriptional regulator